MGNAHPSAVKTAAGLLGCLLVLMTPLAGLGAEEAGPAAAPKETSAGPSAAVFQLGRLSPETGAQIQGIVLAQLKACPQLKNPGILTIKEGLALVATLEGERYQGKPYQTFRVRSLKPGEFTLDEFYIKTSSPWKLSGGVVIPAQTYLAFVNSAFTANDAAGIATQRVDLAENERLCKSCTEQANEMRREELAPIEEKYREKLEAHNQRIDEIKAKIAEIKEDRKHARKQVKEQRKQYGKAVVLMEQMNSEGKLTTVRL